MPEAGFLPLARPRIPGAQVSEIQSSSSGPAKVWEVVQHSRETWQANLEAAPELLLSKRLKVGMLSVQPPCAGGSLRLPGRRPSLPMALIN